MKKNTTKKKKLEIIYSVFFLLLLFAVDEGIFLYAKTSDVGFLTELGKKKLVVLLLENVVVFLVLGLRGRLKKALEGTRLIKIVNMLTLVLSPIIIFVLVQIVVSYGRYEMQKEYLLDNFVVYYVLYLLFLMVFRRVSTAVSVYTTVLILLALVDYFVCIFRGSAFILMDIMSVGTAMEVAGNYVFKIPVKTGMCLILFLLYLLYQHILQDIEIGEKNKKWYLIRGGVFLLILVGVYGNRTWFSRETVRMWDIAGDYRTKGYIYKLACEIQYLEADKPVDYSVEKVEEIAASVEKKKSSVFVVPQNLIVIMNESLADFEEFENFKASKQILPNIHSLSENTKKGYLYVPVFGGGTANTEYEVLTGNSIQFCPNGATPYMLYCRDPEFGMANTLKKIDFSTIALHPFKAGNWNRIKVYDAMNFDEFLSRENWGTKVHQVRGFTSDRSTFAKLKKLCEEKETEKQFLFCVTMQNHGGYGDPKNFKVNVALDYEESYPMAELYLSLIKKTDKDFMKLLQYFEEQEEPTMVVMFGDHWPEVEHGFFGELFGKSFDDLNLEEVQQSHRTPYVIWTNYPSESREEDMSANYFGSYILEQAGLPLTVYDQFLLQLKEILPVIGTDAVCDAQGNWYGLDELPEEYKKLIEEYQILQYNNVFDRRHRVDDIFQPTE